MIKTIIFDFDGVILESMDVKTNAFIELFKNHPEHSEAIVNYHIKNGGLSRYKKFDYIYKNILKMPLDKNKEKYLAEKFSQLALEGVLNASFVTGAQEFLSEFSKIIPLYIASGTPHEELIYILKKREIFSFFKGAYGSPSTKPEIIKDILTVENIDLKNSLYIGDALSDYEDAKVAGIPFLGRIMNLDKNPFNGLQVPLIVDFNDLKKFVLEIGIK